MSCFVDERAEADLAWAAGLFDGEGSTSTYIPERRTSPRRQMAVSQGGAEREQPAVLRRFKQIVRIGSITGPYAGLYYWKITKNDDVDLVGRVLWPYLSGEKRRQFTAAAIRMQRPLPSTLHHKAVREFECAWAAGLFDGEGTFSTYRDARMRQSWRGVSMSIPQASATAVPEVLLRFRAVVGVGSINGPRLVPSPWSRLPQYRWQANGRHVCSAALKLIWPWLGPVKRAEIGAAMEHLDPDVADWMIDPTA
jgi:hypothetical protein